MSKIFNFILDCMFPTFCCNCKKFGKYLCDNCYDEIEFLLFPLKPKLEETSIESIYALTEYSTPIPKLLHAMKYQYVRDITRYCAELLYYAGNFPTAEVITAVPMHKDKQSERGFNQAEEIAKHLSQLILTPYVPLLKKSKSTAAQASLNHKQQRLHNLESSFTFTERPPPQLPRSVLLIDDVTTTGTTLNECAKVLKAHGIQQVTGLVIAHGA